jgi:hypothetical protein
MNATERLVYRLGRTLGVNFLHRDGRAWLRPAKYHYAMIKNAFAEKFTKEGLELCLKDEYGGYLIFDRSNKTGELERMGHNAGQKIDRDKAFFEAYESAPNPAGIFKSSELLTEKLDSLAKLIEGTVSTQMSMANVLNVATVQIQQQTEITANQAKISEGILKILSEQSNKMSKKPRVYIENEELTVNSDGEVRTIPKTKKRKQKNILDYFKNDEAGK